MTNYKQPAAQADHTENHLEMAGRWYMVNKMGMATLCTDKDGAEKEAADAQRFWPHMGPHRAVQLVEAADVEALRARSVEPAGEYPALPVPVFESWAQGGLLREAGFTADQMRAYVDATCAMRAAQPAGAQQPGDERAAFEQWSKVTNQGYDLARNVSGKLQTFESTETEHAWRGFFHGLRASHGQAPAQAAPAAVAGPVAFTAEHVTYIRRYGGSCRDCADENGVCPNRGLPCADSEKAIRFVLEALAYGINHGYIAAPTTQPAPTPSPSPASQGDALDAARYRYLRDGDWREHEKLESVIRLQLNTLWDETTDAARAAQEGKSHG